MSGVEVAPPATNQDYGSNVAPPPTVSSSALTLKDEGVSLGTITSLDVVGAPATASIVGAAGTLTIAAAPVVTASTRWNAWFGSGVDGVATCDGASAVTGMSRSGSVYTLSKNVQFTTLTINGGVTVKTNGLAIAASVALVNNGEIHNSGTSATNTTGAVGATGSYYGNGSGGGNSLAAGGNVANGIGGTGGAGGSAVGGGGIGGGSAGGVVTNPAESTGGLWYPGSVISLFTGKHSAGTTYNGGSGGGGGGGAGIGGGGGGAAGVTGVHARTISGSGLLSCIGGNGANSAAGNGGGGGGGGGGIIYFSTTTLTPLSVWTVSVAGGNGGALSGTGNTGAAGASGTIYLWVFD